MQMERESRSNGGYGVGDYYQVDRMASKLVSVSSSSSPPLPPSTHYCSPGGSLGVGGANYIEHPVSKLDTLAGVAIKYGVEVADIKRINGLVTDLQMFALKTLHIPLPGRHPPSPSLSNGSDTLGPSSSEQTPTRHRHSDLFESFPSLKLNSSPQRNLSPAMSNLQGYYGLQPPEQKTVTEGFEMAVYRKGGAHYLEDTPTSNRPLSHHRKSKSLANGFLSENSELADEASVAEARDGETEKSNEKLVRRRQKSEADFTSRTPERMLKEDNGSGGGFSAITGKGLALRPKAGSRTAVGTDIEAGWVNAIPIGLGDSIVADGFSVVRKSSSTSSLQDQEVRSTSKWSLKTDLQAFSAAAMTRPIFDGLPKPITGRRNKTALD
ncbi:hypothetical protein F0562_033583 [Nyssa sinensis]|uniref:LysM domain-containing protein n=1 Tax=Nyssa sinensis TaxID=561372 RepID=A0A5J5AFH9_9ASTE|nr:hypothetical protein F0562_033583 [Nyssa sinensis]